MGLAGTRGPPSSTRDLAETAQRAVENGAGGGKLEAKLQRARFDAGEWADGETHAKLDGGGPLQAYYEKVLAKGGIGLRKHGRADDGSTSVFEYTVVQLRGKEVPPQAGLAVYERGESGLLRTVRVYDDVDV